ncbi:hypothetical protein [Sulfitobacter sp.]|uniref:hypothetical protein n=1 Tax=Sulfitobacter sp. TaxID=1903071 RepID=UPI003002CC00
MRIEKGHATGNELNGTTTALNLGLGRMGVRLRLVSPLTDLTVEVEVEVEVVSPDFINPEGERQCA